MTDGVWIIGAGGHSKVVIDTLQASGQRVAGVLDSNPARNGDHVLGIPVTAPFDPAELADQGVRQAILAIGDNQTRHWLSQTIPGVSWATAVHPTAYVAPSARIGPGTVVFAGAIVQPDTTIGEHAILNTGSSVDHDCEVGDWTHVAPGARLAGGVNVGEGTFVGIASCVLPGRNIGPWSTVGGGAVVVHDIPSWVVAKGVPARWEAVAWPGGVEERDRVAGD